MKAGGAGSARASHLGWLAALAACAAWLPFVSKPLSPDEGGFLLVASQWAPGHSLYGNYWVDRPPLLITIFQLAVVAGGAPALRLIGIAAVVGSVVLAGRIGRAAAASKVGGAAAVPAVVAATFLATPLFGTTMVNGELLAVPAVLAGILALLRASSSASGRRTLLWATVAGVSGAAAAMIKQDIVDVFLVALALVVIMWRREGGRRPALLAAGVLLGATVCVASCVVWAALHGTAVSGLWDAVVTFRMHASTVIDESSNGATPRRFRELVGAAVLSGAPLVAVVLGLRARALPRHNVRPDLRWPAALLLAWELLAVGMGGSYWLHYLLGLVPGLVLLAAAAVQRPEPLRSWTLAALGIAAVSTLVSAVTAAVTLPLYDTDARVAAYVRVRSVGSDTVVVGFGHPDIVWDSGLRSPYAEFWSLPVRVRDPRLRDLSVLMAGNQAPTWMVVDGTSLATWGVDAATAQDDLEERYQRQQVIGSYVVYRLRSQVGGRPSQ